MKRQLALLLIALFAVPLLTVSCVTRQYTVSENYTVTESRTEYKTETYNDVEVTINPVCSTEHLSLGTMWHTAYYIVNDSFQNVYYFDYEISLQQHDKVDIKIIFPRQLQGETGQINVYDLTSVGHIENPPSVGIIEFNWLRNYQELQRLQQWATMFNSKVASAKVLGSQPYQTSASLQGPEMQFNTAGARLIGVVINGPKYFWNTEISARLAYCDNNEQKKTVVKERQVPYQVQVEVPKQRQVFKTETVPFWEVLLK
jgi:hypothetical protein